MALRSVARPRAESMERAATHSRDGGRRGGSARGSRRFRGLSGGQPDSPRPRVESGCDKVAPHAGGVGMVSDAVS